MNNRRKFQVGHHLGRGRRLRLIILTALAALSGCSGKSGRAPEKPPAPKPTAEVVESASVGGCRAVLTVAASEVGYDEKLAVRVAVEASKGWEGRIEDYRKRLESQPFGYAVADFHREEPTRTPDGRTMFAERYDLSFYVPGELEIPGLAITCKEMAGGLDDGAGDVADQPAGDEKSELTNDNGSAAIAGARDESDSSEPKRGETAPVKVRVKAGDDFVVEQEKWSELTLPEPRTLEKVPSPGRAWRNIAVGGLAAVLLAAAGIWALRRRPMAEPLIPELPPREWAEEALARLLAEDWIERGAFAEFYFRLSGIVRGYLERQFGLAAPEMTTEEFLNAAMAAQVVGRTNQRLLGEFLKACDMVKFARYKPEGLEVEESIEAARRFIRLSMRADADG